MTIIGQMAIKKLQPELVVWPGLEFFMEPIKTKGDSRVEKDFCQSIANVIRLKCNLN